MAALPRDGRIHLRAVGARTFERVTSFTSAKLMRIGANPFADLLAQELADSRRVAARTDLFTAFVPFAARWPVEMHVYPNRLVANLIGLDDAELDGSAQTLSRYPSTVRPAVSHPLPYISALHSTPTPSPSGKATSTSN